MCSNSNSIFGLFFFPKNRNLRHIPDFAYSVPSERAPAKPIKIVKLDHQNSSYRANSSTCK